MVKFEVRHYVRAYMRVIGIVARTLARLLLRLAYVTTPGLKPQTCKLCWKADKLDFHVPDDVWVSVVPLSYRERVICLSCFDDFARETGALYADHLKAIHFAGDRASLEFKPTSVVNLY